MKSYNEFCSVARALDVVGDRWALLVVRELLLGHRRYTDLLEGLPGVGTNVLATRLRELEASGIVRRRRLPAPTPVTVYELTTDGEALRSVIGALARWGASRLSTPSADDVVAPRWLVGSLAAGLAVDEVRDGTTFALFIDDEPFTLEVRDGTAAARHGEPQRPKAILTGKVADFFAVAKGQRSRARRIVVGGDPVAGRRLIDAFTGCLA